MVDAGWSAREISYELEMGISATYRFLNEHDLKIKHIKKILPEPINEWESWKSNHQHGTNPKETST